MKNIKLRRFKNVSLKFINQSIFHGVCKASCGLSLCKNRVNCLTGRPLENICFSSLDFSRAKVIVMLCYLQYKNDHRFMSYLEMLWMHFYILQIISETSQTTIKTFLQHFELSDLIFKLQKTRYIKICQI